MKLGKCLKGALDYIDAHPNEKLQLVQGPPGQKGDTSHFWLVDDSGKVIDPTSEAVPKDYPYKGRNVNHDVVRDELQINEWAEKLKRR